MERLTTIAKIGPFGLTPQSVGRFLRHRRPELSLFLLAVLLRMTMAWRYDATWNYDSEEHWAVVRWVAEHHRVPPVEALLEAYHPPLYYVTAAVLFNLGVSRANMVWLSVTCGTIRLALLWAGLELYLPRSRVARIAALALAAVLAASVHLDGMCYGEPMSGMWITGAMLLVPAAFRRPPATRWRVSIGLGLLLGIAMLTKVSALTIVLSLGMAAFAEFAFSGRDWKTRCQDLAAWAGMLAVCAAVCGWFYARNVRDYGEPFVTTFELPSQHWLVAEKQKVPYLDRRALGYVVGWNMAMYDFPYYPSTMGQYPRFFPAAVASTFVDFWNFSFSGIDPRTPSPIWAGSRPISTRVLAASQYAIVGGTVVFVATLVAWLLVTPRTFRRRDWGLFAILLMPLAMVSLALHFAIQDPVDNYGVVKGAYMHFAAPPLYCLFGVAVAWSRRKPIRWPLFAALLGALWLVATYTFYCRLRLPLLPLS
jgi:hypothetical protein